VTFGVLEHVGVGGVLDVTVYPGSGSRRSAFQSAVDTVVETCKTIDFPRSRALLLTDGEFGSVPSLTACDQAGVPFITRCREYELLDEVFIHNRLAKARWERVPDSGSGPTCFAADVGTVLLHAKHTTLQDDGSKFQPIEACLVVSRYNADKSRKKGRGCLNDGYRYELFMGIRVPQRAWPASDVVSAFYGRAGQECRFDQRQRELHFQNTFSYQPAGQLFALDLPDRNRDRYVPTLRGRPV
jgi:hypothetical protein